MITSHPPELARTPRYCPRCDRDAPAGAALCPRCGERARDQAACPICDRPWRLEAGASCPKHDVALVPWAEHQESAAPDPEAAGGWVTVARFRHTLAAEPPRIRLEAEGIPTFLDGARMGANALHNPAKGGVGLMVPRALEADARVVLDQSWAPVRTPDDDLDEAWDSLEPPPRLAHLRPGPALAVGLVALTALPFLWEIWLWLRQVL
jgi:hypothetical protein